MRGAEDAPRVPFHFRERLHALAEIIERGASVTVEHRRVNRPHPERGIITISENTSRHGNHFAQQWFGFFEAF